MLVTCPRCESIFKLPDNDNLQQKMRCTICSNVFALGEAASIPDETLMPDPEPIAFNNLNSVFSTGEDKEEKKKSWVMRIILILLFLSLAVGGFLMKFTTVLDPIKGILTRDNLVVEEQVKTIDDLEDRIKSLALNNVRQFVVPNSENDKFEKLTVIEGIVVNQFDSPRSFIELEATLYDAQGNPLVSKTQMAGPRVSFFQLQVMGQAELEQALRDNIYVLNYNTNVKPNEDVPFMFIFYNSPPEAANFNIKIINAQIPEPVDNPTTSGTIQ